MVEDREKRNNRVRSCRRQRTQKPKTFNPEDQGEDSSSTGGQKDSRGEKGGFGGHVTYRGIYRYKGYFQTH